jgi:TonB family protein
LALDAPLRAIVLRHEEEHRRAGDPWLLALAAILVVLAPWNVALWWQARRLRLAVELDCDARVLRADTRPERYGLLLLSIAQRRSTARPSLAAGLLEPVNHLERRITAMTPGANTLSRTRAVVLGALAVTAMVTACRADAPPGPGSRAAAAVADSGRSVVLTESGRVVSDSTMITITRKEYERLKAAAEALRIPNADTLPSDAIRRDRRTVQQESRVDTVRERGATASGAYWDFQVAPSAQWITGTGTPVYPPFLKNAGVQGTVLASFVVDTTGRAETATLRILRSSNDAFSDAIRAALPNMRFTPAQAGGRKVKQIIQQEFSFQIDGLLSSNAWQPGGTHRGVPRKNRQDDR